MIQIGHTPDADDAFMFYHLTKIAGINNIELVLEDIETLNRKVLTNSIDCTAVSFYTYFKVAHKYDLLSVGACFGENYGPVLVTMNSKVPRFKDSKIQEDEVVAVPGENTTAYLLLKIYNSNFKTVNFPFDKISEEVIKGNVKYGLLIHEMQQTYENYGLEKIIDLGEYWYSLNKLPLPLGCIIIKKGFPKSIKSAIKDLIKESIQYSIKNFQEALDYAMQFARFADKRSSEDFIKKYVRDFSMELKGKYLEAIETLKKTAISKKLLVDGTIKINII